ncbi:MAG TPA: ATP-binding protein [Polyangia bacterium]|nr:ATP-binding protein [Polyangia bacterium]
MQKPGQPAVSRGASAARRRQTPTGDGEALLGVLEEQVRELRAALENADEPICRTDAKGQFVTVNRAFAQMMGYGPDELVGRSWRETVAPADQAVVRRYLSASVEADRAPDAKGGHEVTGVRKDGTTLTMFLAVVPVEAAPGSGTKVKGHYLFARDITERKRTEEQLIFAGRMAAVGTLAAGVAHEINNPLAYIVANLDFTRRQLSDLGSRLGVPAGGSGDIGQSLGEIGEALSEARQGTDRVRNIVRDLKIFARGDEDASGPVSLRRVLDSSINMAWNEIRHRGRLVKDYGDVPMVEGNESRLGQVFLNLLLNAAQAIGEGEADKNEIRVTTRTDEEGRAVVEIRDTGRGIPAEIQARIFDPFFSTKAVGVGTGLGLWICQGILNPLGGAIGVVSDPGRGAVFRVTLPAVKLDIEDSEMRSGPIEINRDGARVLIIDDEPMILSALRRAIGAEYRVTCVSDGRDALARLKRGERFDVILCDLMMPELTGMDLHDELAKAAPEVVERMIFVTGGAFTPRAREFLDRIPNARVEKPVDFQNLRILIRNLMR